MAVANGKAAQNVRERFSMEFVSAEVSELRNLMKAAGNLPALVLFDEEAAPVQAVSNEAEFSGYDSSVDPVEELRMLFGSAQ